MSRRKTPRRRTGLKKMVQKMISKNLETKYDVNQYVNADLSTVAPGFDTSLVSAIVSGAGQGARVGDAVHAIGVNGKLWFQHNQAAGPNSFLIRYFVYIPKSAQDTMSAQNIQFDDQPNPNEFTILLDRCMEVISDPVNNSVTEKSTVCRSIDLKFNRKGRKGINVQYDGTQIRSNNIRFYAVSSAAANNQCLMQGFLTTWYKDG